ncbi:FIG00572487: hypothetical protein [Crocosphaera watsonii WH 8502]|uniref:Uncharacterized protein n=1 Tax=Crocosphaera watsonii WH 8502 TaxID=423474 RepID=T2ICN4_CROWT|nr:FIG00572487: hypothetical protein [Crocosphaera watsonii WH 8502]
MLSFGIYIIGHLSSDLLELAQISKNPQITALTESIYLVVPNLERFNLKNTAVYGILPSSSDLLVNGVYGMIYIVLLLTISSFIFSRRQF